MKQLFLFVMFGFFCLCLLAQTPVTVVKIIDGDTYKVLCKKRVLTVRLANVDAPELKQNFGVNSKEKVETILLGKIVLMDSLGVDKYNRIIVDVRINGKALDSILLVNGWAWHYKKYNSSKVLENYQQKAMQDHLGLWKCGVKGVCPPWVFRGLNTKNRQRFCVGCKM